MEHRLNPRARSALLLAAVAAAAFLLRDVLRILAVQVAAAGMLAALTLPLCRKMERRLPASASAILSLGALGAAAAGLLLLVIPPLVRQFTQFSDMLPELAAQGGALLEQLGNRLAASAWLSRFGLDLSPLREGLLTQLQGLVGRLLSGAAPMVSRLISSIGRVFLAPLFAFYLLRDRRQVSAALLLLLPVKDRQRAVRAAREMRRETAGFLRGQLLVSALVGLLTGLGLLLTGSGAWLLLGLIMGVMEMIPYVGPLLGGIPAVLLALPGGWPQVLWTLAVLFVVQQVGGTFLSPRLLSGAVNLHPMLVLLLITAGGLIAGTPGMLLALPAAVCVRGALRGMRT